jgi:hypothetical protein
MLISKCRVINYLSIDTTFNMIWYESVDIVSLNVSLPPFFIAVFIITLGYWNQFCFNFSSNCHVANNWISSLYGISNIHKLSRKFPWGGGRVSISGPRTIYSCNEILELEYNYYDIAVQFAVYKLQTEFFLQTFKFCPLPSYNQIWLLSIAPMGLDLPALALHGNSHCVFTVYC